MPPALERRLLLKLYHRDGSDSVSCRTVEMPESDPVIVGRASKDLSKSMVSTDCNFNIPNSVVSRNHAQFTYQQRGAEHPREYQLFIEDLGSSHGTFLNQQPLDPHVKHEVFYNDHVRFGAKVIRTDAEFSPPGYDVEFTELEEESVGRSYSMPSDMDCPSFAYEDDAEHDAQSVGVDDSTGSDYGHESELDEIHPTAAELDSKDPEGLGLPIRHQDTWPGSFQHQPPGEPPLLWNEAESASPSQPSSSQPVSSEQSATRIHPFISYAPVTELENSASSKSKMISIQEILNQDSWPTPQTPTTDRKRKFDAVITHVEDSYPEYEYEFEEEDYSDGEQGDQNIQEDEEDYEPEEVSTALSPEISEIRVNQPVSNVADNSLVNNVNEIAQELKEPQYQEPVVTFPNEPVNPVEPPRKRQKLSSIAVGVGAFIAGSVSTVAALASLPDKFFS